MSEIEVKEAMKGIGKQVEDAQRIQEAFLKAHAISENSMKAYLSALDPKSIIGTNPYSDVMGIRQDIRGLTVKTFGKPLSATECIVKNGFEYPSLPDTYVGQNPFKERSDSFFDVRGIGHRIPDMKVREPYCPGPSYEALFSGDFRKQTAALKGGIDEYLKDTLKNKELITNLLGGAALAKEAGVQPVFVTNWPNDTLQDAANIAEIGAALYFFGKEIAAYMSKLGGFKSLRALLGLGATEAAGGAALAETTVAGGAAGGSLIGPVLKPLIAFGGGYAIGTGINKGLGAALGIEDRPGTKWYEGGIGGRLGEIHHDIRSNGGYLDNAAYFYGRNVVGPMDKWMESVSPKVGEILFRNLGFSVGETDEGIYPNPIRDYAAPPEGIGESVSDIFRRERIVRIENAPPEIKNQNKVNLLINLYEDGRSYVETDLNTEPKIDFRRGYMD